MSVPEQEDAVGLGCVGRRVEAMLQVDWVHAIAKGASDGRAVRKNDGGIHVLVDGIGDVARCRNISVSRRVRQWNENSPQSFWMVPTPPPVPTSRLRPLLATTSPRP